MTRNDRELRAWVMLALIGVTALLILSAFNIGAARYGCDYDDQLMSSSGQCYDLDAILDAAND